MKSACVLLFTAGLAAAVTIPAQLAGRDTQMQSLAGQGDVFRRGPETAQASAAEGEANVQKEAESAEAKKALEEKAKAEEERKAEKNQQKEVGGQRLQNATEGQGERQQNQRGRENQQQNQQQQEEVNRNGRENNNQENNNRENNQGNNNQGNNNQGNNNQENNNRENNNRENNNQENNNRENNQGNNNQGNNNQENNNRENNNRENNNRENNANQLQNLQLQQLLAAQIHQMALRLNPNLGVALSVQNVANFGLDQQLGVLVALNSIGLMSALPIQGINNQVLLACLDNSLALNNINMNALGLRNGIGGIGNLNMARLGGGVNGVVISA